MKTVDKKKSDREFINEAVKDFLSRGGTIKKIDLKTVDDSQRLNAVNHDPDDMIDFYSFEKSHFGPVGLSGNFRDS